MPRSSINPADLPGDQPVDPAGTEVGCVELALGVATEGRKRVRVAAEIGHLGAARSLRQLERPQPSGPKVSEDVTPLDRRNALAGHHEAAGHAHTLRAIVVEDGIDETCGSATLAR